MDFTFKGIKESIISKLKEYSEWSTQVLTIGVYSTIFDVVSFIIEKFVYYVDFRFVETTTNATLRSSVVRIARDHGYTPIRKSGAVGYLLLGDDEEFSTSNQVYPGGTIQILKWRQFQSTDGQSTVYATEDVRFEGGSVQKRISPNAGTASLSLEDGTETGVTSTGHGLVSGQQVYIVGTRNLDGVWLLTANTTANRLALLRDYTLETFTGLEDIYAGFGIVPVREGTPQQFTYIATGDLNEKVPLFSDSIEQYEIEVFLVRENGDPIQQIDIVDDLYFVDDTSIYTCEIENFPNYDGIWVKFGDDITSKRLVSGDRILVKYATTKGGSGNIRSNGIITEPVSPFIDVFNTVQNLFVTNIEPIIGGSELETLLQIKKQYSRLYSSSKQLTSRQAWIGAIESRQFVYKAMVWTELDIGEGNVSLTGTASQNTHYMTAVNTEGNALTPPQETDISLNTLIPQKSPTDKISWQALDKIRIKLNVLAEIANTISFTDMEARMVETLDAQLGVLNLEFKQDIFDSNIVALVDNIQDVVRHETDIYYAEEDIETTATLKDFLVTKTTSTLKEVNKIIVVNNTPEIWLRRKIDGLWYDPIRMSQTSGIQMTGVNLFNVSGTVVYNGTNTSQITYQCFDLLENSIPYITTTGTTTDSSQIVTMSSVSGIEVGMYASGINIAAGSKVLSINTIDNTIVLSLATSSSNSGSGSILFGWFPDMGGVFGARNPDDAEDLGYILYLQYQTMDGNGDRIGDLRLSKFNQILDFSSDLSTFDFIYS